jgi:MFS transporter, DHA1 family, multidrug resistance protein
LTVDDRGRGWLWLLALFTVAGLLGAAFWSQMVAFTPLFLRELGISGRDAVAAWTGAIAAVAAVVGLPLLPFWGALADRYSRQPIIVRSFVAHFLAGLVAALAGNIWIFVLARTISSFSLGNTGLMMTTLQERVPGGRIGLAFAVMAGASPLGAVIGPLLGGPVVDTLGFRALMGIDAAVMAVVVVAMMFGYRDTYRARATGPLLGMAVESVRIILRSPRLRLLFPALFLLFTSWMLAYTYIALVVEEIYAGPRGQLGSTIGWVFGVSGIVTMLLTPALGAAADRFGHWRMLFGTAGVSVVLWPIPAFTFDLLTFTVAWAVLSGVVSSVFSLSFNVLSGSALESTRGRVMTFAFLPVNVGFAIGPALGGVIAQTPIGLFGIFPAAGVVSALGIAVLVLAHRRER